MATTFDAASSASSSSSPSPFEWTHTPVGTPTAVIVQISHRNGLNSVTAVDYGGQAMTRVVQGNDANETADTWKLGSPPAGAQTVSITHGADIPIVAGAVTVTDSDDTTSSMVSNFAANNGSAEPATVTITTAADELIVAGFQMKQSSPTTVVGAWMTERWDHHENNAAGAGATGTGTAGTRVMSWNHPNDRNWAASGCSILAGAAAAFNAIAQVRLGLRPTSDAAKTATADARARLSLRETSDSAKTATADGRARMALVSALDAAPLFAVFPYHVVKEKRRDLRGMLTL